MDGAGELEEWLRRFRSDHPDGGAEELAAWAREQPDLGDRPLLLAQLRRALAARGADAVSVFRRRGEESTSDTWSGLMSLEPGGRVGRFVLREFIARGGMGQVWRAEDTDLGRDVALKLMLPGLLSERAMDLFEREARAGGRLQHRNIVATLACGTDEGMAWISQELVAGSWTLRDSLQEIRALDEVPDGYYAQVAEMVARLADGLHAAHEAGVVHRDLKPANVLITDDDEPKLTDFGLARITDESMLSMSGDLVGSWAYMSPEQLEGSRGLDRRSDVFSLGVVLYELLALRRPFEGDSTHQLSELIRRFEPPTPTQIRSHCPAELSAICAKALEKSPGARFQTAAALAADLRRHLANEPIEARPAGPALRVVKWTRRNPVPTAVGAVGAVTLAIVSLLLAQNVRTNALLASTNQELEEQTAAAERSAARAEERSNELEEVAAFQEEQLERIDPVRMGQVLRAGLAEEVERRMAADGSDIPTVESALAEYAERMRGVDFTGLALDALDRGFLGDVLALVARDFAERPVLQARLLSAHASTLGGLGLFDAAAAPAERALELRVDQFGEDHPDALDARTFLGALSLARGDLARAEILLRRSAERARETLGLAHETTLTALLELGELELALGHFDASETLTRQVLDTQRELLGENHPDTLVALNDLGSLLAFRDANAAAAEVFEELLERRRRLFAADDATTFKIAGNLASCLDELGDDVRAEELHRESVEGLRKALGNGHSSTLTAINNLAGFLENAGELDEADQLYRESLDGLRRVLGDRHPDTLTTLNNLAGVLQSRGALQEAEVMQRESVEGFRRLLGSEHPSTIEALLNHGTMLERLGRRGEAEATFREAYDASRVAYEPPHAKTYSAALWMGRLVYASGRREEAAEYMRETLDLARELFGEDSGEFLDAASNRGMVLLRLDRGAEAEPLLREAVDGWRDRLGNDHPIPLANALQLGALLRRLDRPDEAEAELTDTHRRLRTVYGDGHGQTRSALDQLASLLQAQGRDAELDALVQEILDTTELPDDDPYLAQLRGRESDR